MHTYEVILAISANFHAVNHVPRLFRVLHHALNRFLSEVTEKGNDFY